MADQNVVPGFLLLEDGTLFHGALRGSLTTTVAEVVFTTNMSGYQEVFTDPSYRAQIVVMTAPMIGNYGVNPADPESGAAQVAGVVCRELAHHHTGNLGCAGFGIGGIHAVVPDHRRGHHDDLRPIRGVGEDLLVSAHVRREHDLGNGRGLAGAEGATKQGSVLEEEEPWNDVAVGHARASG